MSHIPNSSRNPQHGFALVISLSLMAFVLLLLLSITTLVQVESSSARNSIDQLIARQNALLALQMAVGQLQKEAGPDQRVTARADAIDSDLATDSYDEAVHPLWTGSWKSYDPNDTTAPLSTIRSLNESSPTWLVSGTTPDPSATTVDQVKLLDYVDRSDTPQVVEAPRVAADSNNDTGGYAWWTSDESLKAKINPSSLDTSGFGTSINESQRKFLTPKKSAFQTVSSDDWTDLLGDPDSLKIANTLNTLPLLTGDDARNDFVQRYSTDATIHSIGILANNRKGGLRKDLTRGLDDQYEQHLSLLPQLIAGEYNTDRLLYYDTTRTLANKDLYGESWDTFFNYYNLYKSDYPRPSARLGLGPGDDAYDQANQIKNLDDNLSESPSLYPRADRFISGTSDVVRNLNISAPATPPVKLDKVSTLPHPSNAYRRIPFSPIRPNLVQVKMNYGIRSYQHTDPITSDLTYRFKLHIYPTFVICNPYNVRMETGSAATHGNRGDYTLYFTSQSSYGMQIGSGPFEQIFGNYSDGNGNQSPNLFGQLKIRIPDLILEPGQVMILGLDSSVDWPSNDKLELVGVPGSKINEDSSIAIDIMRKPGIPAGSPPEYLEATNATDSVRFRFYSTMIRTQVDLSLPEVHSHTNIRRNAYIAKLDNEIHDIGTVGILNTSLLTPIVGYNVKALTTQSEFPSFAHLNPLSYNSMTYLMYAGSGEEIGNFGDATPEHIGDDAFWGSGTTFSDGQSRIILYDVPRQPMQSIGDLMHACFGLVEEDPLYIVGSSYPSPFIEQSKTYEEVPGAGPHTGYFIDKSYYINDRIFDEYFFSTVPTKGRDTSKTFPFGTNFNQTYIDNNEPLPNPRLIYNRISKDSPELDDLQGPDAFETAAANLLLDGPFNINSTSVDAWIAVLSTFRDQELKISDASARDAAPSTKTLTSSELDIPFTRLTAPRGTPNQPWTGFATLNDAQVEELAIQLVEQIKQRGPFFSLGDFINRDPSRATEGWAAKGAIQDAIDNTAINNGIGFGQAPTLTEAPEAGTGVYEIYTENLADSTAANIPGWLSQNDIVRLLAPIMTARGDTFKIRVYGDSKNAATGKIEASAYGEAVIQRTPDFIVPIDSPETELSQLTDPQNKAFGRQFKIIAFNWINDV